MVREPHCHWPFLCLCAQVASKQEVYPSTCRLDESIKVAVSLQTYDSWQTNEERTRLEEADDACTKNPQTDVVVAKTRISIPDCLIVRNFDLKRK